MATGKYDSYYDRLQSTGMNMPTREEFNAYMDTDEGRRGLHSRLIQYGYLDKGTSFEQWGENLPMTTAQEADRREYRKKVDLMAGFEREPVKLSPYVQDEPKLETPMVDMSHYWQDEQKRLQSEDDARQTKAEKEWQEKMSDPAFREQIADELQETFDGKKAEWDYNVGKLNRETNRMVDKTKRENNGRLFGGPKAQTSLYEDKSAIPQQEGYLFMGGKKTPLYYDKSGKEHYDALSTMNANRVYDEVINSDNYWMRHWLERAIEDPEYIGQVRDELINKLQDAEKRRMVAVREYTKDNMFMSALVASLNQENGADPYASGAYGEKVAAITTEIQGLRNQLNELDKAEKKYKAANETKKSDGFWEWNNVVNIGRGMKDTVTDKDFWDMGVGNLQSSAEMAGISKKVQEGKELTDHELNMAMTSMINDSVDQYIKLMGGLPMGYTSGEVTAHAVRFILEMMANPASGFSKGITRQVVRKLGREGAEAVFARRATAIIGNILEAGTLSNTLQGARTLGDAFDRSAGNFGYGQDGKLMVVNDKGFGQALFEAEASSIIENATELMGGGFVADWVGKGVKYAGKYINKFAQTFGITGLSRLGNINWSRWRAMASDLNERAQFHGPFEEWLEEQWGIMLNAAVLNEGEFADLIDPKKQAEIALGVGLMSGFMSSVKTGSYAAEHININREMRRVERETSEHFTPENWALITDGFRNGTDAEIANHLASYLDPRTGLSPEQRSAILNYARTVMRYRGFNRLNESRNDEAATEETTPTSQSQTAERPDIIQTSEVEGYETTDEQTITDTRMRADNNRTALASQLGVEESQVDNALRQMLGDEVTEENIDANLPSDVAQMAKEYLSDSAKTQGVVKRSQDDARELIERTNAEIDRMVNTDTGTIDVATYNGEQVTITSGRVALFEDGLIDRSNSSQSVIIQHQDGTTEMVVPSALENITSQSVDQYKSEAEQRIKSEAEQSLRNKLRGELDYTQGRQYTMLNDNGTQTQVDIIQDNGNGTLTVTARDGKIEGGFTDGKQTTISKDVLWQGVDRQRRTEMRQSQEQAAMPTESDVVSTGNVTYDQMSAEDAFATLMEQTENDIDMVVDIAEEEVGERMQIVEEAENAKPEVGTSIEEKIANHKALREARAKAKADLEKWQGIRAFAENYRRASLQGSQENSNFVEQQNNNNNVLQEGRIDPRADRLVSSEESGSRESEERDGSSRSERQYSRPMEMDGESKNSTPSMGVHRDSQLDRRGRLLVEGNTREERVKNAIAKGAPTKFSKVYGVTHTLHDITPEGVCIYINENGEVSCYLACTDETQIKEDAYVGIFKDKKGKWTSKMENQTGDRELSRSMMVDVIASLPVGAELTEHSSVSADGMRVLANQLKHGWEYTGETYTCELNANDLNSVLGIQGDSEFRSISWAINDIERLRDILEPYMLALGRSREDINILQRGNVPRGKVKLTLPVIVKTANALTYPSAQEIVAQVATQEQGLTSAQQTEAQHQNTQTETIAQAKTESSAERRARREAEARRKGEERARRNRGQAQTQQTEQAQTEAQTSVESLQEQGQQVADKLPASEEVTTETPTESESTPQVGLVEDARTRTLGDKTRKMLDAMARRLGLQVEFVDEIVTGKDEKGRNTYANADIVGNKVRIAWDKRDQALDFLLGHEFTHRMQDLSPEAYAEFVEATKQALGEEEWNKRINRMKSLYKQHGINISEQGIIDEVVADYAGELVEERGVFDNFVERNKNNRSLLSKIADVLRSIKEFFTLGKQRKINNAIARLEALIESASEANVREDVRKGQPLFSLQGNSMTEEEQRTVDEAKANGTYLKAPNGKVSNLNERQWIQVRTKAFKDWFGDWENDPENASKVVDENGEPKVVYHGTWKSRGENYDLWNPKNGAPFYTFNADSHFGTEEQAETIINSKRRRMEEYDNDYSGFSWTYPVFLNIRNIKEVYDANLKWDPIIKEAKDEGYDGLSYENEHEGHGMSYIAFEPTQIKSATDNVGTFDASNPDIRYSLFGGNSGYVGYSMSKRAARAREEGRYPKTDFRKEYGVTAKSFEELVDAKIIVSGEWHHTSMYGNETKFYHWDKDFYADIYEENKKQIDKLSRERKTNEIISLFENHPLELKAEYDNETEWLVRDVNREYSDKIREVENEKRDKEGAYNSAVFDALGQLTNVVKANNGNLWFNASNGVGIQIDSAGNEKSMNYSNANEGNSRDALRAEARNELQTAIENIVKEGNIESVDATYYTDKVNQLEAERAERVAQLVEAREKEYTPKARYSLASDMARDAVMTALEGAGIDVEMATPEMVENVLRARDVEFHIAYHGSGAKFDEFDHSHMGEGEGAQAYGWGTYLTEVEGIAKMYAGANGATMLTYKGNELDTDGLLNQWRVIKDLYDENKGRLREMRNRAERILSLVEEDNTEMKQLWQSVVDTLKQVRAGDLKVKPKRNLYTVEIPDDTGKNYLDYDKEMSKNELNEVRNKLEAILAEGDYKGVEKELKRELDSVFVDGLTASDVYGNVSAYLGGDKQASEFFNEMGYVGIKYPANYRSGGNKDDKKNFVIFNDSDMKITDRVEFLQTPDGTVYGWTIGGKIFLTEQGMNAETPIHEYTHLWANAMRRNNEQGWESVKDLLRGTPMWDEVLADKNYSNIHDNEDLVASEVISRYSGEENAKRLEDEAQRMIDEAKGIGAKAEAVSLIDRVRRALQKFWDWVGKDLFGIKDFDSIEQVTDRVLYDLMNQTDLNAEVSEGEAKTLFSLQGGRSIADKYEKKVNTKGVGGAMHLSKFNFMEAWQDEMRALKEVQRIIEQEYGIELESYEDAYMAENAMSSTSKASWDRYINEVYEPMMRIHDEWIRSGESNESINHYLIAKSGLERNRELMVRDALAEMNKMDAQIINGEYSGTVLRLANALRQGQISQDEYDTQVQEAKNKKAQALEDVKSVQQDRVDAYRAERDALREQLKNGDISYEEFNRLSDEVALKHAKTEEIADYSGLTALAKMHGSKDWQGFAEQMVRDFEAKHSNTDVMWEHINNNTKSAVDYSYKSGVTSKQAKDHLDQMFLWYVPMKGNADVEAEDIYTYVNDKSSSFTPTVKGAKGHSEYVSEDVMALIANTMQSAILQGERNKVKQKFLNMVQNYPTDLFTLDRGWVVMQGNEWVESHPEIKADYTPEQIREAIEKHDAEMRELEEQGLAMSKEGALRLGVPFRATQNEQEHAISVMRNGEKMTIYVNGNPRVAQAINGKLKATPAWGLYETWKRWFSASKTSYSPNFIVSNASRDTGHTAMMTFVQRGLKEQLKALGTYIPAYATLVANAVGKKSPNGYKYDQYLEEFVSNGGVTGYSQLYGVDKFKTDNAKRIARLKGAAKALQQGVNVVENINEIWQNINGIFENTSRFNEYIRSRDRGEDVATSVFNAKNITVNFNKKGGGAVEDSMFHQLAFVGRNWMPFFNPIVQGIYQFLKVGKEHKGRMALACLGFMGGGFLAPILNAMLVGALGGDDEDDYMKQPEWTRRNNFMIYTGDGYAKFALPQMFRELYGIGDILYCAIKGNMSAEDAAMQVVSQIRNMFSLEGQSSQKGKEWDALRFLAPDYFGAVVDIETNTNFTGAPLWKETDYNQYDPDYKKAYNNTWSWLVDFSQKVNEWTGGDEYSKGNVNNKYLTNPAVWQRLITEMGGGLTETIGDVYNTAYSLFTGQGIDTSNIPLVKRLYTETNDETLQKWIDREYYSLEGTHKYVKNRMSKLNKSSALDTADKISMMYYDRDYMIYAIYETYSKEIKELRDQAQSAPEDKKAEIQKREYDAKMKVISLIDNFNAIEDKEVETYMANNPMVARLVGKDIIKKVGAKYKELKRNWKEAPYGSTEEEKASAALAAFEKTPEYQYYDSIRMANDTIAKKQKELEELLLPKDRLKMKAEIDSIKTQLVELRKAYESIGEVKE